MEKQFRGTESPALISDGFDLTSKHCNMEFFSGDCPQGPAPEDNEDEYETVVYEGPGVPLSPKECAQPTAHPPVTVRLAQIATEYGGLLSPQFFLSGSSSDSSRDTPSSSEGVPPFSSESPFTFPGVDSGPNPGPAPNAGPGLEKLERLQIVDEDPPPREENASDWEEWPQPFISAKGFSLGIRPGTFFKLRSGPSFYVRLPHRSSYEVVLTNRNAAPCHLDLYVNGEYTNAELIPAESTRAVDGPQYSRHAFKLFRANEAPPGMNVTPSDAANGKVKAVFTPCLVGVSGPRERSISEPPGNSTSYENDFFGFLENVDDTLKNRSFTESEGAYRSLDLRRVTKAVTLLQGEKRSRKFVVAPAMAVDASKRVTLQLRLIASLDDEVTATDEEIFSLEPPLPPF